MSFLSVMIHMLGLHIFTKLYSTNIHYHCLSKQLLTYVEKSFSRKQLQNNIKQQIITFNINWH